MPRGARTSKTPTETKHGEVIEGKPNGHDEEGVKPDAVTVRQSEQVEAWTPRFAMTVDQAVELERQKQEYMQRVLKDGVHYGMIPGAGKRKVLLKPGAEALNAAMGLHPELADAEPPVVDYTGDEHGGEPFWSFRRVCRIYRQTGPGPEDRMLVAQAEGSCNSFEVKYRYRDLQRTCPVCKATAIYRSKGKKDGTSKPDELGFFCWKNKGGCGANFRHDDARIITQQVGRIKNPEVHDLANTGLKMADKRALVAATLIATGFSTDFTQDIEDRVTEAGEEYGGNYNDYVAPARKAAEEENLTPEQQKIKLYRQVAVALGNSLEPQWSKERYSEEFAKIEKSWPQLLGLLVLHHGEVHGGLDCPHVQAIPPEVDYEMPHDDAVIAAIKAEHVQPAIDPNIDDIPF